MVSGILSSMGRIYVITQTSLLSKILARMGDIPWADGTLYRFFTRITDQMRRRLQSYKETIEVSLAGIPCVSAIS